MLQNSSERFDPLPVPDDQEEEGDTGQGSASDAIHWMKDAPTLRVKLTGNVKAPPRRPPVSKGSRPSRNGEDKNILSSVIKSKMESPTEFGLTPVDWAKKFDATRAFKDNIVREGTSKAGATEEINKKSIEVWLEGVQEDQKEIIEIVKLEIEQLKGSHNEANGGCTIYKIPDIMREGEDPNIYRPTYLLVSPRYNQDISRHIFDGMRRDHYIFHVSSLLNRNISKSLEDYIFTVHAAKDEIRNCYSYKETITLDFEELISLTVNCCFIVDLFLTYHEGNLTPDRDILCAHRRQHIQWVDLLLVENQLPFFILERVFDMAVNDPKSARNNPISFVQLSLDYFDQFVDRNMETPPLDSKSVHHLLHLVHHHLLPSKQDKPKIFSTLGKCFAGINGNNIRDQYPKGAALLPVTVHMRTTIPTATRLQEAGVKFKRREGRGFSYVTFNGGALHIPSIHVKEKSRTLLKNLIAWEQLHRVAGTYFTSYAIFMDYIVDTLEDVKILRNNGIIQHSLGSDEMVTSIFNGLSKDILTGFEDTFLPQMYEELNDYCENSFNTQWTKLKNDYFGSPWSFLSLLAAILLLGLTTLQTFFAVYAYFRPPS